MRGDFSLEHELFNYPSDVSTQKYGFWDYLEKEMEVDSTYQIVLPSDAHKDVNYIRSENKYSQTSYFGKYRNIVFN